MGQTAAAKELRKSESELPRITDDEFNELIGYDPNNRTSNRICFHPGVQWSEDGNFILINVPDHTVYEPIEDMVEINVTEYRSLQKKSATTDTDE